MLATIYACHGYAYPIEEVSHLGPLEPGLRFDSAGHLIAVLCGIGRTESLQRAIAAARRGRKPRAKWAPAKYIVEDEEVLKDDLPPARWPMMPGAVGSRYHGIVRPTPRPVLPCSKQPYKEPVSTTYRKNAKATAVSFIQSVLDDSFHWS